MNIDWYKWITHTTTDYKFNTVEPRNADTFVTSEKCPDLERCPYFRGELIHTCIALGHRKVS